MLKTPEKIETLQRKLYQKAKQEPSYRFYSLYDKVYRRDLLHFAYRVVRANGGGPGMDGVSFHRIESEGVDSFIKKLKEGLEQKQYRPYPVKRVMIPKANGGQRPLGIPTIRDRVVQMAVKLVLEPIFEADFSDRSYGFRPQRSAHQALKAIDKALFQGYTEVIDADLSKYFDTISHSNLLKVLAERIADGAILHIIKMWLKAPVVQVDKGGCKRNIGGGKKNQIGTPQGGVISPLLANLYLHVLDRIWDRYNFDQRLHARLIRYADDFVILCASGAERPLKVASTVIDRLGLSLNEEKTRKVDSRTDSFGFLGFEIKMRKGRKTGRQYPNTRPSAKSVASIMAQVTDLTSRSQTGRTTGEVIGQVNQKVRGWVGYFHFGNCTQSLNKVKEHTEQRVRQHLRNRHKMRCRATGFREFSNRKLYEVFGLYKIPSTAGWR
mgnify:CR=1 FL=1